MAIMHMPFILEVLAIHNFAHISYFVNKCPEVQ